MKKENLRVRGIGEGRTGEGAHCMDLFYSDGTCLEVFRDDAYIDGKEVCPQRLEELLKVAHKQSKRISIMLSEIGR